MEEPKTPEDLDRILEQERKKDKEEIAKVVQIQKQKLTIKLYIPLIAQMIFITLWFALMTSGNRTLFISGTLGIILAEILMFRFFLRSSFLSDKEKLMLKVLSSAVANPGPFLPQPKGWESIKNIEWRGPILLIGLFGLLLFVLGRFVFKF